MNGCEVNLTVVLVIIDTKYVRLAKDICAYFYVIDIDNGLVLVAANNQVACILYYMKRHTKKVQCSHGIRIRDSSNNAAVMRHAHMHTCTLLPLRQSMSFENREHC